LTAALVASLVVALVATMLAAMVVTLLAILPAILAAGFTGLARLVRLRHLALQGRLLRRIDGIGRIGTRAQEGLAVADQLVGQALAVAGVARALHRGVGLAEDPARFARHVGRLRSGVVVDIEDSRI
jgi:hypothetical protein